MLLHTYPGLGCANQLLTDLGKLTRVSTAAYLSARVCTVGRSWKADENVSTRLTRECVAEMRQIFSPKAPISTDRRTRAKESRKRKAGVADLRRALDYINAHGLRMRQNEDGSYEQSIDGKSPITPHGICRCLE